MTNQFAGSYSEIRYFSPEKGHTFSKLSFASEVTRQIMRSNSSVLPLREQHPPSPLRENKRLGIQNSYLVDLVTPKLRALGEQQAVLPNKHKNK